MAPQSPDVAPGPSSASFDPHSSGPCRHDDLRDDKFASPRVDWTRESMCLLGFAMYHHHLPLRTETVSGRN